MGPRRHAAAASHLRNTPATTSSRTVTVRVDGRDAGQYEIAGDGWRTLDIPVEPRNAGNSPFCVELFVSSLTRGPTAETTRSGMLLRGDF